MTWLDSSTAIQSIIVPGNREVRRLADFLRSSQLGVVPIVSPTVAEGSERLRLSVHAFNTNDEIDQLFEALSQGQRQWPDTLLQA